MITILKLCIAAPIKNLGSATMMELYVTGLQKGLIHASDFTTLMSHNFLCN